MTDLTITTVGRQLIADMLAGTETATFTKIQTSSHDYTGVTLTGLTSLSDVKQTQDVSMVTRIDAATVQVLASINNESLASAYYIKAIGLFAEDSEDNEILFAVATDIANPHYMPLPSEYVNGISYKLNVTVDNAGAVTIVIDPAAAPTMAQVVTLSTKIDQVTDMVGTIEATNTATSAHAVGEYFINSDGQLVKTTSAIAVGKTIAIGTNTARTTIAEVMAQANAAISQLNSEISTLDSDKQSKLPCFYTSNLRVGDNITSINVNASALGRTILCIVSQHVSTGDNTCSQIGMLRCGFSGNHVTYTPIVGELTYSLTFFANDDGYLVINQSEHSSSHIMMFANK